MSDDWRHISIPVNRVLERAEAPKIKAIPTKYDGVQFRSRLEARWAAFFDLNGWEWQYEPVDFDGWTPDFLIMAKLGRRPSLVDDDWLPESILNVYAEVKPTTDPTPSDRIYAKAVVYSTDVWVVLLGGAPMDGSIGFLLEPAKTPEPWSYVHAVLAGFKPDCSEWADHVTLWREAGNRVQWRPA
jgi:hypothetical protein